MKKLLSLFLNKDIVEFQLPVRNACLLMASQTTSFAYYINQKIYHPNK